MKEEQKCHRHLVSIIASTRTCAWIDHHLLLQVRWWGDAGRRRNGGVGHWGRSRRRPPRRSCWSNEWHTKS